MADALNGKSEAKLQFKALPSPWSHIMTTGRTFANLGDLAGHTETKGTLHSKHRRGGKSKTKVKTNQGPQGAQ